MGEVTQFRDPPRNGFGHMDLRLDAERETQIMVQWNVDRSHVIVSIGTLNQTLRLLLRPHALERLKAALRELPDDGDLLMR